MKKRTLAIVIENEGLKDNVQHNIDLFVESKSFDAIYVVTDKEDISWNQAEKCSNLIFPKDCDNMPKKRNWLNKYFKTQQYDGMLYVAEDTVRFDVSPNNFFNKLENMMTVLDYPVWFNTIADSCNYLYKKYMPRVSIIIDQPEYAKFELGKLLFTSHSNTAFIAYDFSKATDDQLKFNDKFSIPMYYIIEYLARRRNNKSQGSLFFMNQYLTIPEEKGAFTTVKINKNDDVTSVQMKAEDEIFKSMNVNFASDNNIDQLLEQTYEKLKSKLNV